MQASFILEHLVDNEIDKNKDQKVSEIPVEYTLCMFCGKKK